MCSFCVSQCAEPWRVALMPKRWWWLSSTRTKSRDASEMMRGPQELTPLGCEHKHLLKIIPLPACDNADVLLWCPLCDMAVYMAAYMAVYMGSFEIYYIFNCTFTRCEDITSHIVLEVYSDINTCCNLTM